MIELRQSTAGQEVPLGYFVDSTDGDTEETGLTISNTDIKIWKWGATTLANKNSGGATHISNGIYYATLMYLIALKTKKMKWLWWGRKE